MNHYPSNVKEKLNSIILSMAEHHWLFSKNPGHDFTRQHLGKLSFYDTMRLIISMGKGSTNDEIMDYFDLDPDLIPSQSAFCQRRRQISLSAFEYLFSEFSSSFPSTTDKFKDHCILACDGCHVVYATNSDIIGDYNKPRLIDYKGYNHMHLNGFVDVISKAFLDVVIQPGQQPDEREALHSMLDHFTPDDPQKYIITADRGYESYDLLFHCELKNLGYVFRVKSPSSPKSILSYYASELPDDLEEFDVTIKRFFTDKATVIFLGFLSSKYRIFPTAGLSLDRIAFRKKGITRCIADPCEVVVPQWHTVRRSTFAYPCNRSRYRVRQRL